jgi:hypothetical protein
LVSLILRDENRLRVFENRELRKIFGPKRDEDGSWRKLRDDEIHSLCSSQNIVREVGGTCGTYEGGERCLQGSKVRDHWKDFGIGGRITLTWTLGR